MNTGIIGAVLVLGGTALSCLRWIAGRRRELQYTRAMAAALERMEGAIRWEALPMDRILSREADSESDGRFRSILKLMESGYTLQESWTAIFSDFHPQEAARILCDVELRGDAQQMTGALALATVQLRALAAEIAAKQGQQERLCLATGVSLGGLLVILLI